MTLLEAVISLVILAVSATAMLQGVGTAARLEHRAATSLHALSVARAALERGEAGSTEANAETKTTVERRAWAPGIDELRVRVQSRDGSVVELRRLQRSVRPASQ